MPKTGWNFAMTLYPGHEAWLTHDYGGDGKKLRLSEASLGNFVYHCLNLGGHITGGSAFAPGIRRSYVQLAISLPKGKRGELERLTGIRLDPPTTLAPAISYAADACDEGEEAPDRESRETGGLTAPRRGPNEDIPS